MAPWSEALGFRETPKPHEASRSEALGFRETPKPHEASRSEALGFRESPKPHEASRSGILKLNLPKTLQPGPKPLFSASIYSDTERPLKSLRV